MEAIQTLNPADVWDDGAKAIVGGLRGLGLLLTNAGN